MTKQERKERFQRFKPYIQVGITAIVELFTGAVSNFVTENVQGNKVTKLGVKMGGGLVGLMVGDKATNYVCDSIEAFIDNLEDIKDAIDENKEDA